MVFSLCFSLVTVKYFTVFVVLIEGAFFLLLVFLSTTVLLYSIWKFGQYFLHWKQHKLLLRPPLRWWGHEPHLAITKWLITLPSFVAHCFKWHSDWRVCPVVLVGCYAGPLYVDLELVPSLRSTWVSVFFLEMTQHSILHYTASIWSHCLHLLDKLETLNVTSFDVKSRSKSICRLLTSFFCAFMVWEICRETVRI